MSSHVEWDAHAYDSHALPQLDWGKELIERLELGGDETVLDGGCGTGMVTRLLLERLPRGHVIGVDASRSMIAKAEVTLGDDDRVDLRVSDLLALDLSEEVDAVFSSATFHWIIDHETLFARLFAALRPGGQLEAQCGGQDNIAEVHRALDALAGDQRFSPYLRPEQRSWNFASVGDTEARLGRAGFDDVRVWLEPRPVTPRDPDGFLRTVILPWYLERLPPELHDEFVEAVLSTQTRPVTINYLRLNISARKPG